MYRTLLGDDIHRATARACRSGVIGFNGAAARLMSPETLVITVPFPGLGESQRRSQCPRPGAVDQMAGA